MRDFGIVAGECVRKCQRRRSRGGSFRLSAGGLGRRGRRRTGRRQDAAAWRPCPDNRVAPDHGGGNGSGQHDEGRGPCADQPAPRAMRWHGRGGEPVHRGHRRSGRRCRRCGVGRGTCRRGLRCNIGRGRHRLRIGLSHGRLRRRNSDLGFADRQPLVVATRAADHLPGGQTGIRNLVCRVAAWAGDTHGVLLPKARVIMGRTAQGSNRIPGRAYQRQPRRNLSIRRSGNDAIRWSSYFRWPAQLWSAPWSPAADGGEAGLIAA
jgi:hypothetical protein